MPRMARATSGSTDTAKTSDDAAGERAQENIPIAGQEQRGGDRDQARHGPGHEVGAAAPDAGEDRHGEAHQHEVDPPGPGIADERAQAIPDGPAADPARLHNHPPAAEQAAPAPS